MKISEITPLIITYNEAPNIERCLNRIRWASRVVVIDSGSADATLEVCDSIANVEVFHREFDSFATQCNFGLRQIESEWVLSMDADYIVPRDFAQTISDLRVGEGVSGYRAKIRYCIEGVPLRSGLYPPRCVLYRRELADYENDGHGHKVNLSGGVTEDLSLSIDHDDRKCMAGWLHNQVTYAQLEAEKLSTMSSVDYSRTDRLRSKGWILPILVLPYCLIFRRGLLDGWPGWSYSLQRLTAEVMLAILLVERRLKNRVG